ncbi:hypothetical protein HRED_06330 [Candidatus Haloredivivus sp. G17]|nr:hypothetical protein HRED_06330 [Candidatus Haloredivivus sp. G17]
MQQQQAEAAEGMEEVGLEIKFWMVSCLILLSRISGDLPSHSISTFTE